MSSHPPHIVDDTGNLSLSSFIPFCSLAGNMSVMGQAIPHFSIPVCNKFKSTILREQLCYQVDLNEFVDQVEKKKLMTEGFVFLMDYNEDRQALDYQGESHLDQGKSLGNFQDEDSSTNKAMIYINTIGKTTFN